MAPTLVIAGYYGFGNWGDETALAVLIRHLRRALPHAQCLVLSHNPVQTAQLHGTGAINRWNPFEIRRAFSRASGFILGPGSLLQDATSTRSLLYYLSLLRWAQRYNVRTYLIGQGIGPLRSERSERWVATALRQARLVLVRDQASYQWALAHGAQALLGEDLAVLYDLSPGSCPTQAGERRRGTLALSLRPGLAPTNIAVLRRALRALSQDFELVFLPFQADRDLLVLRELALPITNVKVDRPDDLLRAIQSADVVLGMRLHSVIFALMCAVPFCALSYDPKIESFARRVEQISEFPLQWWKTSEALDEKTLVQHIIELYTQRAWCKDHLRVVKGILQSVAHEALNRAIASIACDLGER